jgi:hypothetical protein
MARRRSSQKPSHTFITSNKGKKIFWSLMIIFITILRSHRTSRIEQVK